MVTILVVVTKKLFSIPLYLNVLDCFILLNLGIKACKPNNIFFYITLSNYINLFKVFHSGFIFEILDKLLIKFEEKHIDLILTILRTIGFNLRKDNPTLIKKLLLDMQKKSSSFSESTMRYKLKIF